MHSARERAVVLRMEGGGENGDLAVHKRVTERKVIYEVAHSKLAMKVKLIWGEATSQRSWGA